MKLILCPLFFVLSFANTYGQNNIRIDLKHEKMKYSPKGYFITSVVDDRTNQDGGSVNGRQGSVTFDGGPTNAIERYIAGNVRQDRAQQAVSLHISTINFDVRKKGPTWNADAQVAYTFFAGEIKLVEYSSKGSTSNNPDPAGYGESFLRQSLEGALKNFDTWWSQNKGQVPTSDEVKLSVKIARTMDKEKTIVYSRQRLLQISDFEGRPENTGREMAATMSGIGFGYSKDVLNGNVVVDITITPYFEKDQSWFKEAGKNPNVLAHEQTHFDITAAKACELATALRSLHLTKENYEQQLDMLQKQYAKATGEEQDAYDTETGHGTVSDKQDAWSRKVRERLAAVNCY
jgi:hypothetical protein